MFEKFIKNRDEMWLLIGNTLIVLFIILVLAWFLPFAVRMINNALTAQVPIQEHAFSFNMQDFEKLKPLLERKNVGFSKLHEVTIPPDHD